MEVYQNGENQKMYFDVFNNTSDAKSVLLSSVNYGKNSADYSFINGMKIKKFGGTEKLVYDLVLPIAEELGYDIWDVSFEKEGAYWYLRVFIDHEDGITIDDCTDVSHAIDPIIDEADPIDKAYYLEVCSPGLERELSRPEHFIKMQGEKIKVKLYKGNIMNAGVTSPYSLYDENVASFGDDGGAYNQQDSAGFINLFGLSIKVKALLDKQRNEEN